MSSAITEFAQRVVDDFAKTITDEVFRVIENDRQLLQEYLRLVSDTKLDTVNQIIDKKVKERFSLTNDDSRQDNPKCKLIKSHQQF